ncbi:Hsp90 cochaperone [Coemansia sp. RSA 1365]|nr:Hsp90 cochaperone [Coemansia sp. RSA 1365]
MSTANELKAKGNEAFAAGDHEEAVKLFTQAIGLDPKNHVLYSNRSASLASLKKYAEALKDAEETTKLKPNWPKGYSRKGSALFGLRKFNDARGAYETGLKHDPNNALLKKGLADTEAALSADNGAGGLDDFSKNMSNAFQDPNLWAKLAGNSQTASFLADQSFVAKIKDIQANQENMRKYADDQRIMIAMLTLMGMGDMISQTAPSGSTTEFSVPKSSSPPPPPASAPKTEEKPKGKDVGKSVELTKDQKEAEEAKAKGNAAYKARKFKEALESYSKAIELNPADIIYYNNKSAVYYEMGKLDDCIKTAEKAIEVGRKHRVEYKHIAKALGRIGTAYAKKEDLDKAIQYYNQSLTEHRTADVLNKLRTLERLRKLRAEEKYRDEGKSNEARERGNKLFKAGKFAEAQAEYSEAIKRNPGDPRAYSNRAACLIKLVAIPDAIKDCDKCISIDSTFVKAYIRKANALFLMREYAEALDALEEVKVHDKEKKNSAEADQLEYKCYSAINEQNARLSPEEALKRAQENPRIASILANPVMQNILQQMQSDPRAAREHLKNPAVASNLRKLIAAGIVRMG